MQNIKKHQTKRMKDVGFAVVEIVMVIVIIAIMTTILVALYNSNQARMATSAVESASINVTGK